MNLTVKQENFCTAYIEIGNASEAYRRSYNAGNMKPETINREAKELLDTPKITTRVDELRAAHAERHNITVDSLTIEYEAARILAKENKQPAAMVSATTGKARLHGLIIDKQEHTGTVSLLDCFKALAEREVAQDDDEAKQPDPDTVH